MTRRRVRLLIVGLGCAIAAGGSAIAVAAYTQPEQVDVRAQIASYDPLYGRAGKRVLVANLDGRNEIDPAGKPGAGNPIGRGLASIAIRGKFICVGIVALDSGTPLMAHIHKAPRGTNGPIVVTLATPAPIEQGSFFAASSASCQTAEPGLLDAIRRQPGDYYVNVHTTDFPAGAIRGQIRSAAPARTGR